MKKYVEYLLGPHGRSPACLPFPPLLSLPSKALTVLPSHPISDSFLFVIQPFTQASSSPRSLPQAPFCHDMGDTVGIVCSVEIELLSSFSPLLLPNLSTGLVRSKPKKSFVTLKHMLNRFLLLKVLSKIFNGSSCSMSQRHSNPPSLQSELFHHLLSCSPV